MDEIFAIGCEKDTNNNEVIAKIVFGNLRALILISLPWLVSFCSIVDMPFISEKRQKLLTTCSTQSVEIILEEEIDVPMPLLNEKVLFPNLEVLELSAIDIEKINLASSSASFENLVTLNVQSCDGLANLITPSTARSLVQLTKMSINRCKMITEIVADDGDVTENDIIFSKLKWLSMHILPCLTSFCSAYHDLKFASLEQLIVGECPEMKIFSQGVLRTPRLLEVQLTVEGNDGCWYGDLNTTIQQLHRRGGTSLHHNHEEFS